MKYVHLFTLVFLVSHVGLTQNNTVFTQNTAAERDIKINQFVYGTLLQPQEKTENLLIIIPGSGPTDRNGNQQLTRNNSLRLLAEKVTASGIATFRYDKRVLTLLKKGALDEEKLRFDDFVEDALATVTYFKNRYQNIYIIGHSQGSLVGMIAAQQSNIAGYISLAGPGQAIDQTILSQIALQMPDLTEKAKEAFTELKETGKVKNYSPALASIFRKETQPFMASWMQYIPTQEIKKLQVPVLIVNGTNDIQVDTKEAEALKNAKPDATLVLIENMNHVLRIIEGADGLENTKSYNESRRPISKELIEVITNFISN
ncbi:alpha/beta fold hydrolase [uncultured Dokdonia sp.]|uniref:alpha/beta hydrolase n=1 Tax=uncultured Dokdonia sp. TaxID=575653 RepID=UPI0026353198|nr:alpha/beta fold hydrolase [uncultured Dokdonia sp.]